MTPSLSPTQLARQAFDRAVDLLGDSYTPVTPRPWLTERYRADLARQFDCHPDQVEFCLDARDRLNAYAAERAEREYPFSHRRPGARPLTYAEKVF